MSFSSSGRRYNKNKHQGSSHYKKTGFLDKLINLFGSRSHSNKNHSNPFKKFSSSRSGSSYRKPYKKKHSSWS